MVGRMLTALGADGRARVAGLATVAQADVEAVE